MSKSQRRDHPVTPHVSPLRVGADGYHEPKCMVCGDRITLVKGREHHKQARYRVADHWRHWRRP